MFTAWPFARRTTMSKHSYGLKTSYTIERAVCCEEIIAPIRSNDKWIFGKYYCPGTNATWCFDKSAEFFVCWDLKWLEKCELKLSIFLRNCRYPQLSWFLELDPNTYFISLAIWFVNFPVLFLMFCRTIRHFLTWWTDF